MISTTSPATDFVKAAQRHDERRLRELAQTVDPKDLVEFGDNQELADYKVALEWAPRLGSASVRRALLFQAHRQRTPVMTPGLAESIATAIDRENRDLAAAQFVTKAAVEISQNQGAYPGLGALTKDLVELADDADEKSRVARLTMRAFANNSITVGEPKPPLVQLAGLIHEAPRVRVLKELEGTAYDRRSRLAREICELPLSFFEKNQAVRAALHGDHDRIEPADLKRVLSWSLGSPTMTPSDGISTVKLARRLTELSEQKIEVDPQSDFQQQLTTTIFRGGVEGYFKLAALLDAFPKERATVDFISEFVERVETDSANSTEFDAPIRNARGGAAVFHHLAEQLDTEPARVANGLLKCLAGESEALKICTPVLTGKNLRESLRTALGQVRGLLSEERYPDLRFKEAEVFLILQLGLDQPELLRANIPLLAERLSSLTKDRFTNIDREQYNGLVGELHPAVIDPKKKPKLHALTAEMLAGLKTPSERFGLLEFLAKHPPPSSQLEALDWVIQLSNELPPELAPLALKASEFFESLPASMELGEIVVDADEIDFGNGITVPIQD